MSRTSRTSSRNILAETVKALLVPATRKYFYVLLLAILGGIAACAPATDDVDGANSDLVSAACAGSLSSTGKQIVGVLQSKHGSWKSTTWDVTCNNSLEDDWLISTPPDLSYKLSDTKLPVGDPCEFEGADCNTDFRLKRCAKASDCTSGRCARVPATVKKPKQTAESLCLGHSDFPFDAIYDVLKSAKHEIVIASLNPFTDGYLATIRNAITLLNERARAGEMEPISVRVVLGLGNVARYLDEITRDIQGDPKIRVSVGTYGGPPWSWNHAKLIAVDGREAIVGGHIWSAEEYNQTAPVHDVSMRVSGGAATSAVHFFDYLWDYAKAHGTIKTVGDADGSKYEPTGGEGDVPIIAVGATGGVALNPASDSASDSAIFSLIDSAKKVVRIDQQDLVSIPIQSHGLNIPQHISNDLLEHISLALLREVDVYLLLSETYWWNGWTLSQVSNEIRKYLLENMESISAAHDLPRPGADFDITAMLCKKLHIAGARDGVGALVANHAKVVIADDDAFYMGSQNLYPGGLADPLITQLAEFGYIVDDEATTQRFIRSFWEPVWNAASPRAIAGSGSECIFASDKPKHTDCSTGWPSCKSGQVCSWNGPTTGYCCKAPSNEGQYCASAGDGRCSGICAAGPNAFKFYCTEPDRSPCLPPTDE